MKNGKALTTEKVHEARDEEMSFLQGFGVYGEVDLAECYDMTGEPPVSTKWAHCNKGTERNEEIRCRWVARDFKPKGEKDHNDHFGHTTSRGEEVYIKDGCEYEKEVPWAA